MCRCLPKLLVQIDQELTHHVFVQAKLTLELLCLGGVALELHGYVIAFAHIVDLVGQAALAQLLNLADDFATVGAQLFGNRFDFRVHLGFFEVRTHDVRDFVICCHETTPLRTSPGVRANGSRGWEQWVVLGSPRTSFRWNTRPENSPIVSRRTERRQGHRRPFSPRRHAAYCDYVPSLCL